MHWGSVAAIAVLAVAGPCDNASAAEWKVAKLSGSVFIKSGPMRGIALTSGMILRDGLELIADKSGRALLIHGSDQMIVSPTSTAAIPVDRSDGIASILQNFTDTEVGEDRRTKPQSAAGSSSVAAFVKG